MTNENLVDDVKNNVSEAMEVYSPAKLPSVQTIAQLTFWFVTYIQNMLVANGVENSFSIIRETASGRANRQSIKQTITSNFALFAKAANFGVNNPLTLQEICDKVINGTYNLQDLFTYRVKSETNTETLEVTHSLVKRDKKAIVKAIANLNTQLRKQALTLLSLSGKDANGKLWDTLTFSNEQLLAMFVTEATNNLTAKRTVKVIKRSELESQNALLIAEIAELKAMVKTA